MRLFPRATDVRVVAAAAATAIVLGTIAVPSASADDDLKDRQRQAERKIDRAHEDVDASSKELRAASARLESARSQLSDARTALATARGRLAVAQERDAEAAARLVVAEATLAQAQAELDAGRADLEAQREVVGDTIKQLYAEGDPDLMAFSSLIDAQSAQDLTRRAEANEAMVDKQARDYDRLQASEVLLEVHEDRVAAARDDVAAKRAEAADNLAETRRLEIEAEAAKASVVSLVTERSSAREQAAKIRARDVRELKQAQREKERIEERLRRIAARALAKARARAAANGRVGPTTGLLQMPVGGGVTSPFGWRTHPIYGYWGLHDGTDFGGGCGTPIVAAESGRVISSYWSDVYGNRLIVDHGALAGAGVASIYNHASSYTVGPGSTVSRGDVIGYVGDTGWSTGCHLHFTVMANGKAVDPARYF